MDNILIHKGNINQNDPEVHFTLIRMLVSKKQTTNAGEDAEKRIPIHCWWKCKLV
jgi:hypothetical protein